LFFYYSENCVRSVWYGQFAFFRPAAPHVGWQEMGNDGFTPTAFYWNGGMSTPVNLPGMDRMLLSGGTAHIIWSDLLEGPVYYWNSATQSAVPVPAVGGSTAVFDMGYRNMFIDSAGTVHIFFSQTNEYICLAHWDSVNQSTAVAISSDPATTNYCAWPAVLKMDSGDRFHALASGDPKSGQQRDLYLTWQEDTAQVNRFWSDGGGLVDLSMTAAVETYCYPPVVTVGENGRLFLAWMEESDTAGEGLDIFAAWIESTLQNSAFLPLLAK